MKIVHICISAPYIDGWGYQENLLPEYLSELGTDNYVICCANIFPEYLGLEQKNSIKARGKRYTNGAIKVVRIMAHKLTTTFIVPRGLHAALKEIAPDVVFHHGINCTSLVESYRYCRKYGAKLFVDNHADEYNISKNKVWVLLYHKVLLRCTIRFISDHVALYYGVTNGRCSFMTKYYGLPCERVELLPIGADTNRSDCLPSKDVLRQKYGYSSSDKIVITGGKMGVGKGTDTLIRVLGRLNDKTDPIKLILFGKFEDGETEKLAERSHFITRYGWCDRQQTLELLKIADVACWPVHHTTLIEDAVSVGTPLILRKTTTTAHLIEKNGFWIDDSLEVIIDRFFTDKQLRLATVENALQMKKKLSYTVIANRVINDIEKL